MVPPSDVVVIHEDGHTTWRGQPQEPEAAFVALKAEGHVGPMRILPDKDAPAKRVLEVVSALQNAALDEKIVIVTQRALPETAFPPESFAMRPLWLLMSFGMSLAAHVGLAGLMPATSPVSMPGGEVSGDIALGLGFADLVAGSTGAPMTTLAPVTPATPDKTSAHVPTTSPNIPTPQHRASTEALPSVAPVMPTETIAAKTPEQPAEIAEQPVKISAHRPEEKPAPPLKAKSAPPPSARGNAAVNNTKGRADGVKSGAVAEANTKAGTAAKEAGNGAIKSYQASVLRKIARVPKRSAGMRGASFVRLSIAPSGAITSAQVVKSSGHSAIDTLAVSQIRRAGPFNPTPSGQSISVVVKFESKG